MAEKETIILDFQVDQGSAIQELERTKKIIIGLQQEQRELNDAYKKGNITLEEYVSEQVRLEAILKKQQSAYTNTQKSVTGVKTKMDDLIKSNQNLNKSLEDGLNNATVFGTNLGGLKNSVMALASPVGLVTGIIGGLTAAYARSSIGAKDLEFAQNQLAFATTILTDKFAGLFSSAEDGEGFFSKLTSSIVASVDITTAIQSRIAAQAQEDLENIQEKSGLIQAEIQDRLAENAELMTELNNSETSLNKKKEIGLKIQDNLSINATERLNLINEEISAQNKLLATTKDKGPIEGKINRLKAEAARVTTQETKGIEKVNKLLNAQINAEAKKTAELRRQEEIRQTEERRDKLREQSATTIEGGVSPLESQVELEIKLDNERVEVFRENTKKQEEELKKRSDAYNEYVQSQIQLTEDNFNTLAQLFSDGSDARRLFGLAAIGVDTAQAISALTAASEANPANAFTFGGAGIAQYAAGIIRILANIAAAKEFLGGEFAGGTMGKDFVTTKPTLLLVGDNPGNRERVTVEPLSGKGRTRVHKNSGLVAMAGGGSMTFDGAKETAVQIVAQNLQLRNSLKNMPSPVVSWVEGERVGKRVRFKESVSRL